MCMSVKNCNFPSVGLKKYTQLLLLFSGKIMWDFFYLQSGFVSCFVFVFLLFLSLFWTLECHRKLKDPQSSSDPHWPPLGVVEQKL